MPTPAVTPRTLGGTHTSGLLEISLRQAQNEQHSGVCEELAKHSAGGKKRKKQREHTNSDCSAVSGSKMSNGRSDSSLKGKALLCSLRKTRYSTHTHTHTHPCSFVQEVLITDTYRNWRLDSESKTPDSSSDSSEPERSLCNNSSSSSIFASASSNAARGKKKRRARVHRSLQECEAAQRVQDGGGERCQVVIKHFSARPCTRGETQHGATRIES